MTAPKTFADRANAALPYVVGALVMVAVFLVYDRYLKNLAWPSLSRGSSGSIVMVDVVRIVNAQNRLAVSSLGGNADGLTQASRAGSLIEQTIREVAGPGTIVLVKQGVVAPEPTMVEITDEVLKRLALPLDAPTVDVIERSNYMQGPATNFSGSPVERVLDDALARKRADTEASLAKSRREQSEALIP